MRKIYFKGLTIAEVAELLKVTYLTAYHKCKEPSRFTGAELMKLQKATGETIETLLNKERKNENVRKLKT